MEAAMVVNYLKPRLSPLLFEEVLKAIRNVGFDQPQTIVESEENDTQGQDLLELENFELPEAAQLQAQYTASATENPRSVQRSVSAPLPCAPAKEQPSAVSTSLTRDRCVSIKDLVVLGGESPTTPATAAVQGDCNLSSSTSSSSPLSTLSCLAPAPPSEALKPLKIAESMSPRLKAEHGGLYVEKGVGSPPRPVRVNSDVCLVDRDVQSDTEAEDMPAAAGAVAAGAVADRLLGPKERRQLAIVLVGLPARGKTFTAAKLTRYLRWLGHDTKHFNVGKYRRLKHGCNQNADFFRVDNHEGVEARQEVAVLAMEDLLLWMQEGGQIGVFDATNSTRQRRDLLMRMAEGKCKIIFLESICTDKAIIDRNIRLKIQQSPDYAEMTDYEAAAADFKNRLLNYEKGYEPVEEGSYIKMIDMASGQGGQMQVNNISGYLPGRIVFFLVNTHIIPRPILLTRHGESRDNVRGRIGGDPVLSEAGERYTLKLAQFVKKRLKNERTTSIWTSTLQRTVLTARHIVNFPKVQWRALDEINAGICDGMTYQEIKDDMPEEHEARKLDKLRYRYPRGESYLDVIQRLEPVIIELERQRSPVVVIAHQAVLRSLYAYFTNKPLKEIPHIEMPLHTVIEIQMGVSGVQEKRYRLIDTSGLRSMLESDRSMNSASYP